MLRSKKINNRPFAPHRLFLACAIGFVSNYGFAEDAKPKGYNLQLEEVLVTAQKREEDTMSVPITVNAFTAQDMLNTGR
jgi:hypothetical protein